MKDSDSKLPDQKELEKELNDYLGKKYGDRIRLVVPHALSQNAGRRVRRKRRTSAGARERLPTST